MTTTAIPLSTQLPCGPDRVSIDALHLSVTGHYDQGTGHNVHIMENGDLGVILSRGQRDKWAGNPVAHDADDGLVIVTLGVDGDHDEIHYSATPTVDALEVLGRTIESLIMARDAVRQVVRL